MLGQYGKGTIRGKEVPAYRDETWRFRDSSTPTYAALRVMIDNWRWKGVPFYLRSGKRWRGAGLKSPFFFKPVPHLMFSRLMHDASSRTR